MRVISEDGLHIKRKQLQGSHEHRCSVDLIDVLIDECKELNPWIPLEEFLKSGFEGWCWINSGFIDIAYAYQGVFYWNDQVESPAYDIELITHVQPIHKPEPPI